MVMHSMRCILNWNCQSSDSGWHSIISCVITRKDWSGMVIFLGCAQKGVSTPTNSIRPLFMAAQGKQKGNAQLDCIAACCMLLCNGQYGLKASVSLQTMHSVLWLLRVIEGIFHFSEAIWYLHPCFPSTCCHIGTSFMEPRSGYQSWNPPSPLSRNGKYKIWLSNVKTIDSTILTSMGLQPSLVDLDEILGTINCVNVSNIQNSF